MEVGEPVLDIPIPSDIYHWVESYVLENYRPEERKKRRRENGLMNPLNRVLVPCRTGNSATMEDESQSLLRRWSICNVPGKRLATIDESLVPGQTPADEQPIGEDDQCDDVETFPNDSGIA